MTLTDMSALDTCIDVTDKVIYTRLVYYTSIVSSKLLGRIQYTFTSALDIRIVDRLKTM